MNKICILSQDNELLEFIKGALDSISDYNYEIICDENQCMYRLEKPESDLLILDGNFIDIFEKTENITQDVPILIMIEKEASELDTFDFNLLDKLNIYDFIRKPFMKNIFINKVKLMLRIFNSNQILSSNLSKALSNLWNLLNYTNLYVLVLDHDMRIKLANYPIAKFMGFENEVEAIEKEWMPFVPNVDKEAVNHVMEKMMSGKENYTELTNDISNGKETITVRWFNSYVNTGTNWVFSIGVPISHSISTKDNIDAIRAYYRDVINKDKEMIKNIKELTKKNLEQIDEAKGISCGN